MKSMLVRSVFWVVACFSIGLSGCAQGAPAAPVDDIPPPVAVMAPTCGNGKMDVGELCDCPVGATTQCEITPAATCDMLMNGYTGTLLCDAKTCTYNMSLCTGPGGTGTAGTGK
ncbi:MAG TPA: hypothetical protein VGI70_19165 [Polyangiales bacterium]|jgi:hypothetical protein